MLQVDILLVKTVSFYFIETLKYLTEQFALVYCLILSPYFSLSFLGI